MIYFIFMCVFLNFILRQFKPQQLNKKIFDPLKEVEREKQFTIPKPFNFIDPPSKVRLKHLLIPI